MKSSENIARYFPEAAPFSQTGCRVVSFGFEYVPPNSEYPLHHHPKDHLFSFDRGRVLPTWGVIMILDGRGCFDSDRSALTDVRAGDLFLLFPKVRHRYRPHGPTGWSQWWIEMSGDLTEKWISLARLSADRPVLPQAAGSMLIEAFHELAANTREDQPQDPLLISSLALQVLARVRGGSGPRNRAAQRSVILVRRTRQLLREQAERPEINWDRLSQNLGVSYSSLRHTFVKSVGISPGKYHLLLRQRCAVSLLSNSDLSISEIAHKLGFESIYYFSRFIKLRTGLSPRMLRARGQGMDGASGED